MELVTRSGSRLPPRRIRLAAELPAWLEELDAGAGAWVRGARLVVQLEAEPGTVGDREAAVGRRDRRGLVDQLGCPGVGEVVEVLQDPNVRGAGGQVQVGCGAD